MCRFVPVYIHLSPVAIHIGSVGSGDKAGGQMFGFQATKPTIAGPRGDMRLAERFDLGHL